MVLGIDKGAYYWSIPVLLILYNVCRGYITWRVAPMRDSEERSGYSPTWFSEVDIYDSPKQFNKWERFKARLRGYQHIYLMHQYIVRWVFWLAIIMFIYNAYYWLIPTVGIPK